MAFLKDSYICMDCEWIGENSEHCEKCASAALSLLSVWIESLPMTSEGQVVRRHGAVLVEGFILLRDLTRRVDL